MGEQGTDGIGARSWNEGGGAARAAAFTTHGGRGSRRFAGRRKGPTVAQYNLWRCIQPATTVVRVVVARRRAGILVIGSEGALSVEQKALTWGQNATLHTRGNWLGKSLSRQDRQRGIGERSEEEEEEEEKCVGQFHSGNI